MARALFLSLPLHGHTNPSLPLVTELSAGGDRVVAFSTAGFTDVLEAAGAVYRPYRCEFLANLTGLPDRMDQLSWLLMRATEDVLAQELDRKSTRLNSSHLGISYAVFCLKKKKNE